MSFDLDFGRPTEAKLVVNHGWENPGHAGLDIGLPVGTPLIAVADGTIKRAEPTDSSAAGIHVDLQTDVGAIARYLHMSQLAVRAGERVRKGQLLGYSGNTGLSTGPHLHFEIRVPEVLLPAIAGATGVNLSNNNLRGYLPPAVPAEPWLPVDSYSTGVISNAAGQRIPLYHEIRHPGSGSSAWIWGGVLAGLGYWIYRKWFRDAS